MILADLRRSAIRFDDWGITSTIDCCCELYSLKWACLEIVVPFMSMLESDEQVPKRVAAFASQVVLLCLKKKALDVRFNQNSNAPLIISGCAPYQKDELYGYMISLLLALLGYKIVHMESHCSLEDLLLAVDAHNVSAIVLHAKKPNERSVLAMRELVAYLNSLEYVSSFKCYHKFVRKPQLFCSGEHGFEMPAAMHVTLHDLAGAVVLDLFGKQLLRVKDDMLGMTQSLISDSVAKLRVAYKSVGARCDT